MQLTEEQAKAVDLFNSGDNVAVSAIPGAGKSALIVQACFLMPKPCLVLAYNTLLAHKTREELDRHDLGQDVECRTFHSLCSQCLRPAKDDAGIQSAITLVKDGTLVPHDVPEARSVCIDEAQDVRELYVELLKVLGLCFPAIPTMTVGDENQLLYDFDDDFPATLDTLHRPEQAFGSGAWHKITLTKSHRLTSQMACLARALFGTEIYSDHEGPPLDVRVGDAYRMTTTLNDVLRVPPGEEQDVLLLVHRKRANVPLRKLVNALSQAGRTVHIHGIDVDDPAVMRGKLRCSTWWAAKGMQIKTAIVLVPRFAPRNPLYVALTRAFHRLIIHVDSRGPNVALCRALASMPRTMLSITDEAWARLSEEASREEDSFDPTMDAPFRRGDTVRCDGRTLPTRLVESLTVEPCGDEAEEESGGSTAPFLVGMDDGAESVETVAVRMALLYCEWKATGTARAFHDLLSPMRLKREDASKAAACKVACRFLTSTYDTLAEDILNPAIESVARLDALDRVTCSIQECAPHLAAVAVAVEAWDHFEHTMRQLMPVSKWCQLPSVHKVMETLNAILPREGAPGLDYDTVLCRRVEGSSAVARVHASCEQTVYHVVWNEDSAAPSQEALSQAAIRADLHSSRECRMVDALHGWVRKITPHESILTVIV